MMDFKTFACQFDVKADGDGRTITGYASTFGPPADAVGDVVDTGAFKKTIKEGGPPKSRRIKLLWLHRDPLGLPTVLKEDDRGLYFEARVTKTQFGNDCLEYIRDGVVDKMSIGYNTIRATKNPETGYNHLKEIALFEISPVPFPANLATDILGVKSLIQSGAVTPQAFINALVSAFGLKQDAAGLFVPESEKGATRFRDLPLTPRDRAWDATAADRRVREWADAADGPNENYSRAFFWFDNENPENFGSYKLGFADIVNDELVAVPQGIIAAAAALQGARGGVDIPDDDVAGVRAHIARYYEKMSREFDNPNIIPPWDRSDPTVADLAEKVDALSLRLDALGGSSVSPVPQGAPSDQDTRPTDTPKSDPTPGDPVPDQSPETATGDQLKSLSESIEQSLNLLRKGN
jgi:HK97 family phage prohead protease